jgi:hypothetical protein
MCCILPQNKIIKYDKIKRYKTKHEVNTRALQKQTSLKTNKHITLPVLHKICPVV